MHSDAAARPPPNHWNDVARWSDNAPLPLNLVAHVTYTHTSAHDVWPLLWSELERFTRTPAVSFVLCINRLDARVPTWLRQVVYDADVYGFGAKAAHCITAAARPYVLFVQEDFIPLAPTNWTWISHAGRLLRGGRRRDTRSPSHDADDSQQPGFVSLYPISDRRQKWHPVSESDPALRTWHTFAIQPTLWRSGALLHILKEFSNSFNPFELEQRVNSCETHGCRTHGRRASLEAWLRASDRLPLAY